jgi:multicomponent Na+:H+ antiporter subunit G
MSGQEIAGGVLLVLGTFLIASAGVGMIRLPDIYNRTNAVAKAATLGVALVLAGVLVLRPTVVTAVTVVLAIAAQLFTAPIAGYAVGRAAYRSRAPLASITHRDDLADRSPR